MTKARETVEKMTPYVCARDLYRQGHVLLDANENAFASASALGIALNRYPDPDCRGLREALAGYCGASTEEILVGNGSDEIISLAMNAFAEKGDNLVAVQPTYPMYEVYAEEAGIGTRKVNLTPDFRLDLDAIARATDEKTRLVMLVSPNSALGTPVPPEDIRALAKQFEGIVFVDEAYYEYGSKTAAGFVKDFDNLVVSRTLSKAWGLAGLRVGYCISAGENIKAMRKIKPPYNVSSVSQFLAKETVETGEKAMRDSVKKTIAERDRLAASLRQLGLFVYPSVANFVLTKLPFDTDALKVQGELAKEGIIVRERTALVENSLRVTVGTQEENALFLEKLSAIIRAYAGGGANALPLEGILIASDVDGTILEGDTIFELFRKYGFIEEAKALDAAAPGSDVRIILEKIAAAAPLAESNLETAVDAVDLAPGAREFYARMEALGAKVLLLTAAYEPMASRVGARLGLKAPLIAATRLERRNGVVTGVFGPVVEGAEKKKALERVCRENGFLLKNAVGIGDSLGDAAFMECIKAAGGFCLQATPGRGFWDFEEEIASWVETRGSK